MPAAMKRTLPALLLALGACGRVYSDQDGTTPTTSASGQTTQSQTVQALQTVSNTATDVSQVGSSIGKTALAANAAGVAQTTDGLATLATDLAGKSAAKGATVDLPQRLEYQDVYTELGDAEGMRALVPYLLHPETWTLIKCEMLSATSKHYRFQRINATNGRSLPEVDIFKGRR